MIIKMLKILFMILVSMAFAVLLGFDPTNPANACDYEAPE